MTVRKTMRSSLRHTTVEPADFFVPDSVAEADDDDNDHCQDQTSESGSVSDYEDDDYDVSSKHYMQTKLLLFFLKVQVILEKRQPQEEEEEQGRDIVPCTFCNGADVEVCLCRFNEFQPSPDAIDRAGFVYYFKQRDLYKRKKNKQI